jgi:RimJ/RimL family protein N-acetyltransferase
VSGPARAGEPSFRLYDPPADEPAVIELVCSETWPHRPKEVLTEDEVREEIARAPYDGEDAVTVMIELDGELVGFVRADGLREERTDPQLDFRLRERVRGRGIGLAALRHVTALVFERHPTKQRIEAQTRVDNVAMRKVLLRGGYAQEAVYRRSWPGAQGRMYDGVGYAILRGDWESGTTTPVRWEEP